jgi:hypothetical protein
VLGHYRIIIHPLEQADIRKKGEKLIQLIIAFKEFPKGRDPSRNTIWPVTNY